MDSTDLVKSGRLKEARGQLVEELRSSPADLGKRTLLFQVLCFCGEWEKAERQLGVIAAQDPRRETGVQVYTNIVQAEKEREQISKGNGRPSCLPHVPAYLELHFAAWEKVCQGKIEEAQAFFSKIDEQRPSVSGSINGKPFQGFRDTDTLFSYFLEAIVHERYVWIPIESVRELIIPPPATMFDLLWASAQITSWEGLTMTCYLPALYPESYHQDDERIKLGRMTDWLPMGGAFARAVGQHVYEIGEEEVALLEIREVQFNMSD
jgi:type VI secretion system protein ImpE